MKKQKEIAVNSIHWSPDEKKCSKQKILTFFDHLDKGKKNMSSHGRRHFSGSCGRGL